MRPSLAVRYARVALTQQLKELMLENLGYGLALEGLSAAASWPGAKEALHKWSNNDCLSLSDNNQAPG
jgi:hypothetical protein